MADKITTLTLTDAQLQALNDIVRQHKVTLSNEELVLVAMGKRTSPLIEVTVMVGSAFEKRVAETQKEASEPKPVSDESPKAEQVK